MTAIGGACPAAPGVASGVATGVASTIGIS